MKPALLVIDVINDFVTGKFGSKRAQGIVPNVRSLLDYARGSEIPVIYVTDAHRPGDQEFQVWGEHAVKGTVGAKIVDDVSPREGDLRVYKRRYSSFFATNLDLTLREMEVDTLILTGLVTNICIQHTAADAFFRGYDVVIPSDCVEAASEEAHQGSLDYIEEMYKAKITTSDDIKGGEL